MMTLKLLCCLFFCLGNVLTSDTNEKQNIEELPIHRALRQVHFPREPRTTLLRNPIFQANNGGTGCLCGPVVYCGDDVDNSGRECLLNDGTQGKCCFSNKGTRSGSIVIDNLFKPPNPRVNMNQISTDELNAACNIGRRTHGNTVNVERQLKQFRQTVPKNTPARNHFSVFTVDRRTRETHNKADEVVEASRAMKRRLRLSELQGSHGLNRFKVSSTILDLNCPRNPRCNSQHKYRTPDGSCNNLGRPLWGSTNSPLQRILPPKYDDGVWTPRTRATDSTRLKNPRFIANTVLIDQDIPDQEFTLSVMQWAQFVDHDIAHSPFKEMVDGNSTEAIECCINKHVPKTHVHRFCDPIPLENDEFFNPKGIYCMNFVRTMLALDDTCKFGHAEQVNAVTHWLDASNVYGSHIDEKNRLRTRFGGLLRVSGNNHLPLDPIKECQGHLRGISCYYGGDSRVNEQPGLSVIHVAWHREHNRIANQLRQFNPHWSDEALYQETKRIVTAEYQHIVYNEWLPIILGQNFMSSFGLNVLPGGQHTFDYNSHINPQLNNEFSTGAYRFGHSLVQGQLKLVTEHGSTSTINLHDHFNSPHLLQQQPRVYDQILRSLMKQPIQAFDSFVSKSLTNHLFQTPETNFGMDLMTINIHRGRDHAIATYNEVREICGLPKARSFQDITDQIPQDTVRRMMSAYKSVDDIDFFVGGLSERPVSGGLLGWTFLCVVGDQFARLKKADRFFHDIGGQAGSFNPSQLQEIRKASWARIICDNSDNIKLIQPLPMRLENRRLNRPIHCNSLAIPSVSLRPWQGERPGV